MPSTSLGITYPCVTDDIGPSDWSTFASSTDAAIQASINLANTVLQPNFVYVQRNTTAQTLATGVTTTASYDTEIYDRGNMFSFGSPTIITLPSNGSYQVTARREQFSSPATVTSFRMSILVNGVEFAYHKEQANTSPYVGDVFGVSVFLPARTAGDQVTVNHLFTGTGSPSVATYTSVIQVANV